MVGGGVRGVGWGSLGLKELGSGGWHLRGLGSAKLWLGGEVRRVGVEEVGFGGLELGGWGQGGWGQGGWGQGGWGRRICGWGFGIGRIVVGA